MSYSKEYFLKTAKLQVCERIDIILLITYFEIMMTAKATHAFQYYRPISVSLSLLYMLVQICFSLKNM